MRGWVLNSEFGEKLNSGNTANCTVEMIANLLSKGRINLHSLLQLLQTRSRQGELFVQNRVLQGRDFGFHVFKNRYKVRTKLPQNLQNFFFAHFLSLTGLSGFWFLQRSPTGMGFPLGLQLPEELRAARSSDLFPADAPGMRRDDSVWNFPTAMRAT
jgi:hypothetical protein